MIGLSQDQLADQLDVSKASVSSWELNKTMPEAGKLSALRTVLKTSLDELICGDDSAAGGGVGEAPAQPYVSKNRQLEAAILEKLRSLDAHQLRGLLALLTTGSQQPRILEE